MLTAVLDEALEALEEVELECKPRGRLFPVDKALARDVARRAAHLRQTLLRAWLRVEGEAGDSEGLQGCRCLARWVDRRSGARIVLTWDHELKVADGPAGPYQHLANVENLEAAELLIRRERPAFQRYPNYL